MPERPRLLVLDLLESYARERDVHVRLERRQDRHEWICEITDGSAVHAQGKSAREAIRSALKQAGIEIPA
jgi:hypothetical protein